LKSESPALLDTAHTIVDEMLKRLRELAHSWQERMSTLTVEVRQIERAHDEVAMQLQFAQEQQLPSLETLTAREQQLRTQRTSLQQEAQTIQRSLKQLDQLVRQIDMSSTTLGSSEGATSDPWIQALQSQVIQGREEERVRLAREVHDGPAQVLANTLYGLEQSQSLLERQHIDGLAPLLGYLCGATREGLQEVRTFIADLRPGRLDEQGLAGAIREYIERYQTAHDAKVTVEIGALPRLSREAEIVLYRIVQESLQNAHKHARGAAIAVHMGVKAQKLVLIIRDDGPGFDPREVARRAGRESWGLTSMRERAQLIGARYTVTSRPGQGTEVSVVLPLTST
jgi:two-component system sensor histidine kinase DegS